MKRFLLILAMAGFITCGGSPTQPIIKHNPGEEWGQEYKDQKLVAYFEMKGDGSIEKCVKIADRINPDSILESSCDIRFTELDPEWKSTHLVRSYPEIITEYWQCNSYKP